MARLSTDPERERRVLSERADSRKGIETPRRVPVSRRGHQEGPKEPIPERELKLEGRQDSGLVGQSERADSRKGIETPGIPATAGRHRASPKEPIPERELKPYIEDPPRLLVRHRPKEPIPERELKPVSVAVLQPEGFDKSERADSRKGIETIREPARECIRNHGSERADSRKGIETGSRSRCTRL